MEVCRQQYRINVRGGVTQMVTREARRACIEGELCSSRKTKGQDGVVRDAVTSKIELAEGGTLDLYCSHSMLEKVQKELLGEVGETIKMANSCRGVRAATLDPGTIVETWVGNKAARPWLIAEEQEDMLVLRYWDNERPNRDVSAPPPRRPRRPVCQRHRRSLRRRRSLRFSSPKQVRAHLGRVADGIRDNVRRRRPPPTA